MARALLGYVGTPSKQQLELEVARLRARVRILETQIGALRAEAAARHLLDSVESVDSVVDSAEFDRLTAEALSTSA